MKKKIIPVLTVVLLILIIIAGVVISSFVQKYTPSKERADLTEHFQIQSEDQIAIIENATRLDTYAKEIEGEIYLDYAFVHDTLNSRFYWDENENILFYTTAKDLISVEAESGNYLVTKDSMDFGPTIVKPTSDSAWIHIDFVKQYSDFTYSFFEDPSRIVLTTAWGDIDTASVSKNTEVRVKGGIKSPILADVEKATTVRVLEEDETWTKVMLENGIIGYIRSRYMTDKKTESITSDFEEETFSHIKKDFKICMAWHQVTATAANGDIASVLSSTKGVNVISPTWFYLNDNEGNLANLASLDYVNYCHSQGVEVWALFSNLENKDADSTYVLTHTSTRQNLVNQIVSMAIQYNLDGINLDFEALDREAVGDAYIQFVRELSLKCQANGIVLSIDNYVPTEYTSFYCRSEQANFADYIIMMGYDEHYAGSDAGSVASLSWVEQGIKDTLKEVPEDQMILGMPFYTRIWCLTPNSEDSDTEIIYETSSTACGMRTAMNQAKDYNVEPEWLEDCGQYYAEYEADGSIYKIWIENAESIDAKLQLCEKYALAGGSFWKLGFETSDTWDTIIKYLN